MRDIELADAQPSVSDGEEGAEAYGLLRAKLGGSCGVLAAICLQLIISDN
jgi:hypothetical protein